MLQPLVMSGQYSIPDCIDVLRNLKGKKLLKGLQFTYALELIKDSKNRVIVVSLKYCAWFGNLDRLQVWKGRTLEFMVRFNFLSVW